MWTQTKQGFNYSYKIVFANVLWGRKRGQGVFKDAKDTQVQQVCCCVTQNVNIIYFSLQESLLISQKLMIAELGENSISHL